MSVCLIFWFIEKLRKLYIKWRLSVISFFDVYFVKYIQNSSGNISTTMHHSVVVLYSKQTLQSYFDKSKSKRIDISYLDRDKLVSQNQCG